MALRKVLELRIVSARALKVEKTVLSSLDQYGCCWRIQEELLRFPKMRLSGYKVSPLLQAKIKRI